MRLFIIAKQIRSHDAIHFRIKVREEIGMTKKNPVKEAYIINFHDIQYNQKSCKEIPKAETISNAIQNTQNSRTCKQKYCDPCNDPANYMRTRESFLMVRHCIQNFLWCRREEFLVLNKSNATIQNKKICYHNHNCCNNCYRHFKHNLLSISNPARSPNTFLHTLLLYKKQNRVILLPEN